MVVSFDYESYLDLEYANHHEDTNSEHYIGGNRYIQCVNDRTVDVREEDIA